MIDQLHNRNPDLPAAGAITLALALGIVYTIAGLVVTGYPSYQIDGPQWLLLQCLIVLFFCAPAGLVIMGEIALGALRNLSVVRRSEHLAKGDAPRAGSDCVHWRDIDASLGLGFSGIPVCIFWTGTHRIGAVGVTGFDKTIE